MHSGLGLPVGAQVWLPPDTLAGRPSDEPSDVLLAARETPADEPAARPAPATRGSYVVRPGDTLLRIATAHGTDVATLRRLNRIPAGRSVIHAGQRLSVPGGHAAAAPAATAATHRVRKGETLSGIARAHGVALDALLRANGMTTRSTLVAGRTLVIPRGGGRGGSSPAQQAKHVVRRGETLVKIAMRYGVQLVDLLSANNLTVRSIIRPGQAILIP